MGISPVSFFYCSKISRSDDFVHMCSEYASNRQAKTYTNTIGSKENFCENKRCYILSKKEKFETVRIGKEWKLLIVILPK